MNFTSSQLQYAISALSNLLGAGTTAADAMREMGQLQPKQAQFWQEAAKKSANGQSLSETLHPILDLATFSAINAAENSGTLPEVFAALEKAMEEKAVIRKTMRTIIYPFAMLIGAIGVFTMFLGFVVPNISRSMPSSNAEKSKLNVIADILHEFLVTYDIHLVIGITTTVICIIFWLRNPANRNRIVATLDNVPLLGSASRDLFYGEWAMHMAINTNAGITVLDAIHLTHKMLPTYYHPELLAVANDITRIGSAAAASKKSTTDPRNKMPFLIVNAFRFAESTGIADKHFNRAANALIIQGKKRVEIFVAIATHVIIPVAASLAGGAMLPYFLQIGDSFSKIQ
ncbi:type II secretion system F family protein [Janthinobacterium sp. CAN_S7]|uniref:type II secretion system F family protein n=1 Tax=Janthinobacterium sp. CAN_S7 TaxID=3071704 RepID=UPI00319DAF8A